MARRDARELDHKTLEQIRTRAVEQVQAGESPEAVIKALGFSRSCIYTWLALYRSGGWAALKARALRGWLHMKDESAATAGVRPSDPALLQTATTYNWSVPASSFPKGNYVIRVEAYRDEIPLHYAFHQYRAFIKRP